MASDHDKRYKKLFSHPVIVKELLLYFIDEAFIKNLDFSTVSAIFYVENSKPEELRKEFHNIVKLLEKEQPDIILLFKRWLNNLFQTAKEDWDTDNINEQIEDLMEVKVMFETALKERDKRIIEQERLALAKKMKEEGLDTGLISKITGLTIEEISEL